MPALDEQIMIAEGEPSPYLPIFQDQRPCPTPVHPSGTR